MEPKEISYLGKVVFQRITLAPKPKRITKFFSEDEACFLFLTKGAFQFRMPTNILQFDEGDAMLSKCGNYFIEEIPVDPNSHQASVSAITAYFYPSIIKKIFQTDLSLQGFQNNFDTIKVNKANIEPLLKSFLDSINYLLDNPSLADENMIVNKLKELLLLLSKSEKAASINAFVSSLFVPYEYSFNKIIQQNLYSNLSLDELAHLCNSSLATFKRKFTELYNESPAKYILLKKLEKSSELLQIKSIPIADIAYECGFETVTNFNKAFKKHFGEPPTEYRLSQIDN
ncbi:MAG: helix-turn-helix domain-containing protein [Sphingobacteriales bacterium]